MTEECGQESHIATNQVDILRDKGEWHLSTPMDESHAELERGDIKDSSDNSSDDLLSNDQVFSCNGCGEMMSGLPGTKWYRCTECIDIDICESCHNKDFHNMHRSQISAFTCPQDIEEAWCDACGKMFTASDMKVVIHQCKICEDYVLCSNCRRNSFHERHKESMTSVYVPLFGISKYLISVYTYAMLERTMDFGYPLELLTMNLHKYEI